jgi:endogenous inhibitor of DNA gyrase (YacG/DUF329 family)
MLTKLANQARALVYCPICTHTVEAEAGLAGKKPLVVPGQKCPRCASALDAGLVVQFREAA